MTQIEDIHALVEAVELTDFIVHEERARRIEWPEGSEPAEPLTSTRLGIRADGKTLCFRFRLVFADPLAEFVSDIEVVYEVLTEEPEIDPSVVTEFAERVAFMAVYPYIRASIFAAAGRIGTPAPVLGIVRQGDFSTGEAMTEDEVRREFFDNRSEFEG